MKYALIENNIVKQISYQPVDGWEQVSDNVFAEMIKKSDGSFNYSDEFLAEQEQYRLAREQELAQQKSKKESAKAKLSALGLDEEEIKAIIGV
jgi:TFIIF-interacting CTD phosphatase-like protein